MDVSKAQQRRNRSPLKLLDVILVVTEGRRTEVDYLVHVKSLLPRGAVRLCILQSNANSPLRLKQHLQRAFRDALAVQGGTTGWVLLDRDFWDIRQIHALYAWSKSNPSVRIALSNPCFEVWLAYHFTDLPPTEKTKLHKLLTFERALLGTNKKGLNRAVFSIERIQAAVLRAQVRRGPQEMPSLRETDVHVLIAGLPLPQNLPNTG